MRCCRGSRRCRKLCAVRQSRARGVLVKAVKPGQERRVDLPVIGARTVELAAAAGLSGIAVQQNAVLVLNRARVAELADLRAAIRVRS